MIQKDSLKENRQEIQMLSESVDVENVSPVGEFGSFNPDADCVSCINGDELPYPPVLMQKVCKNEPSSFHF
jgi:hypothetical protein